MHILLQSLPLNKASGLDGVSCRLLKEGARIVISSLRLLETLDIGFGKSARTQRDFNLSPSHFQQSWLI